MSCAGGANDISKEVAEAFPNKAWESCTSLTPVSMINPEILPCSAKVVIGDLDLAGAEAVISSITTNGGFILFNYLCSRSI